MDKPICLDSWRCRWGCILRVRATRVYAVLWDFFPWVIFREFCIGAHLAVSETWQHCSTSCSDKCDLQKAALARVCRSRLQLDPVPMNVTQHRCQPTGEPFLGLGALLTPTPAALSWPHFAHFPSVPRRLMAMVTAAAPNMNKRGKFLLFPVQWAQVTPPLDSLPLIMFQLLLCFLLLPQSSVPFSHWLVLCALRLVTGWFTSCLETFPCQPFSTHLCL